MIRFDIHFFYLPQQVQICIYNRKGYLADRSDGSNLSPLNVSTPGVIFGVTVYPNSYSAFLFVTMIGVAEPREGLLKSA